MSLILVVDDRAINREFLATLLGYCGHRVIEAADGGEALTLTRAQHPDLVISDVLMPVMDGVEFANRLHADPSIADIPIIFYTATYRLKEGRILAQSCGVVSVLAKPAEPKAIINAVDAALGTASQLPAPAPLSATTTLPARFAAGKVSAHLGDLAELRLRIQKIVEAGLELIGEQGELRQVSEGLIQAFGTVQASSLRLAAVLELGLDLASERQPQQLLDLFCRAAQDIMNARYASLCLGDGDGVLRATTRGMSEETSAFFSALDPRGGLLEQLLGEGRMRRLRDLDGRLARLGVAPPKPPIQAFLAVPVTSATRACGWLYVADKLGADEFSEEDEEFASTLAAQLALAYENLHLYEQSRQHVAQLETEIAERRRMQEEVQIREEQFRSLAETAVDGIVTTDAAGRVIFWNSGAQQVFGYSAAEMLGQSVSALMPERYRQRCAQGIRHYLNKDDNHPLGKTVEQTALRKDGMEFPIDLSVATWRSRDQVFFTAIIRDITERHEQREKIARLSRIQAVLSGINSAIVRLHEPLALFNEACRVAVDEGQFGMAWVGLLDPEGNDGHFVAGIGPEDFAERRFAVAVDQADGPCPVNRALHTRRPAFCNNIADTPSANLFLDAALRYDYRSLIALPLLREQRAVGVMVLYARESGFFDDKELSLLDELAGDLSFALEYIDKAERLDYLVYYDALTGLANRSLVHDRLRQLLQNTHLNQNGSVQVGLALINIERFKNINDSFGRHSGDALLKQIAARLISALGSSDRLARLGSDHFAAILADVDDAPEVARVVGDTLLGCLDPPFVIDEHELHITVRAGITLFPSDGGDAETLFANAETALHKAATAEERYLFYAPPMNARVAEQLTLENKLHKALAREEFVLYYQPKVNLQNGQVIGLEALIRWQDPDNGLVPPKDFIPALEETGLIVDVGRWALEQAVADYGTWHAAGLQPPRIAVNVSAVQLRRKDFLTTLEKVLSVRQGARDYLDLELTESMLMEDIEANVRRLGAAREMGVKIAIDDFGTGYSSLSYLKRFPIDLLKIDQSFVRDITTDPDAAAICIAVIGLAHNLKLKVIAEGVETTGQMNYLRQHRCDQIQGYLFSRPLPADACGELFAAHSSLTLPQETMAESKSLLIVDDESNILQALRRVLRKGGYEILTAGSAREGFDVLANHPVQVILSDQRMPEMNGTEFLSRVRELYPDTIRIVLSGYTDLETITEAVNRGAIYRFLTKPWDDDLLRQHIQEAFRHQEVARRQK